MEQELGLDALDGANPIGYLAALGVLRVLSEAGIKATLRWEYGKCWVPKLGSVSRDQLIELLVADVEAWRADSQVLSLEYEKTTKKETNVIAELKPPPEIFQDYARMAADCSLSGLRNWADYVAAFGAAHDGVGVDNSGATKPTAFHFCAGKQYFIQQVRDILAALDQERIEEAVFGPWRYDVKSKVLGWDLVAGPRSYALCASDPGASSKNGVPGADWLAFRGLCAFPVALVQNRAVTTGFQGQGKHYRFTWALWSGALDYATCVSVVGSRWSGLSERARASRGIKAIYSSEVSRTDKGYGCFLAPTYVSAKRSEGSGIER